MTGHAQLFLNFHCSAHSSYAEVLPRSNVAVKTNVLEHKKNFIICIAVLLEVNIDSLLIFLRYTNKPMMLSVITFIIGTNKNSLHVHWVQWHWTCIMLMVQVRCYVRKITSLYEKTLWNKNFIIRLFNHFKETQNKIILIDLS